MKMVDFKLVMEILSKEQILRTYPLRKGQLNHLLLHRHKNGLDSVVLKIGKNLFFDKLAWDSWLRSKIEKRAT